MYQNFGDKVFSPYKASARVIFLVPSQNIFGIFLPFSLYFLIISFCERYVASKSFFLLFAFTSPSLNVNIQTCLYSFTRRSLASRRLRWEHHWSSSRSFFCARVEPVLCFFFWKRRRYVIGLCTLGVDSPLGGPWLSSSSTPTTSGLIFATCRSWGPSKEPTGSGDEIVTITGLSVVLGAPSVDEQVLNP